MVIEPVKSVAKAAKKEWSKEREVVQEELSIFEGISSSNGEENAVSSNDS